MRSTSSSWSYALLLGMGAETMIALDEGKAIEYAARFAFSAMLIGMPPRFRKDFLDALGGLPVIFYGSAHNVVPIKPSWVAVQRDVPEILRALEDVLGTA